MNKALPSGPRRDEAADEEDRRQRKRALGRVTAAMIQSLQPWMEIMMKPAFFQKSLPG
jgi:hypothetical protein